MFCPYVPLHPQAIRSIAGGVGTPPVGKYSLFEGDADIPLREGDRVSPRKKRTQWLGILGAVLALTAAACEANVSPQPCPPCVAAPACEHEPEAEAEDSDAHEMAASAEEEPSEKDVPTEAVHPLQFRLGVDVLFEDNLDILAGKRVGLITNASGVDGKRVPTARRFVDSPHIDLRRLFAPEHGLRGELAAGTKYDDAIDPIYGVEVASLYGKRQAPVGLQDIDVLVFDIQDVGSRTYTYVTTLLKSLEAAASQGIEFVVLDRPNPAGGCLIEGPILEPKHQSFVGYADFPVTHGMTFGEIARMFDAEKQLGAKLTVIPMQHWRRHMLWEDTGLAWIPTSPNIPHARHALLYVATGMVAGLMPDVYEGANTPMPFEIIIGSQIDAEALALRLNADNLPGVSFRAYDARHKGKALRGVQLMLDDPHAFRPLQTAIHILAAIRDVAPHVFHFKGQAHFARHWGNEQILKLLEQGAAPEDIMATWRTDVEQFRARQAPFLLYPGDCEE
ncbi:MAG: DUF1343 domain-containing protein [Proteobacteria bacterium]|nr:DUF1343 domain-containing protein [Pseudomonadota bacterium]